MEELRLYLALLAVQDEGYLYNMSEASLEGIVIGGTAGLGLSLITGGTAAGPAFAIGGFGGWTGGLFSGAIDYYQRLRAAEKAYEEAQGMLKAAKFWLEQCKAQHNQDPPH